MSDQELPTDPADWRSWLDWMHDATLLSLSTDYERGVLELRLDLWVGDLTATTHEEREARRPCRMVVSGLQYCVIEPPALEDVSILANAGPPSIDAGEGMPPTTRWPFPLKTSAAVRLWIYVSTWNSFIWIAGASAEFH